MAHLHEVYDTDKHFSIDPITRAIKNNSASKTKVMQYDHNSERFAFIMPKTVEAHDMSLCNKVRVEFINIDSKDNTKLNADAYEVDDLQTITTEDDGDQIVFSWLISQNATKLSGSLNFLIRFMCIADDGTLEYAWHTDIFTGISVSSGMYNGEIIVEQYSDVLEAWKKELEAAGGGGTSFSGSASDVTYDDTETKLGATNIQDAVGKLSEQKVDNPSTGAVGQILEIESVGEDGKPKTYKAVDKPICGGVTSWNDLKDKPFGESGEEVWVLDKTSLIFAGESSNSLEVSDEVVQLFTTAGNKVYVYWNGVIHECEVQYHNVAMYYYISFGNYTAFLEGNTLTLEFGETMIGAFEFGLLSSVAELKQLDEKYIPETIARKEDIPENTDVPENVLTYSEQSLTEEQAMQARKNLGLYYSEEVTITEDVFSYVYVGWWEVSEDNLSNTSITNKQYLVTLLDNTYEVYGKSRVIRVSMVGIVQGLFWIGNPTLIDNVPSDIDISGETDYTDLPFVVYWNKVNVDTGDVEMIGSPTVVLDPSVSTSMIGQGLFIGAVKGEKTVHTTIPNEFIPILYDYIILNSSDESGKQFKITVNDEGTLTATEITD